MRERRDLVSCVVRTHRSLSMVHSLFVVAGYAASKSALSCRLGLLGGR